ncbi:fimbria/pilus periplasmic chaperone [bacterium]|nr:fimbria/pilus periplasmic chaperone [bacterium]MBU1074241.1 fimbria/pilus periplasmic chaperone [bacterium]MBU1675730.1 fimbria/pilus periplasmic chaperone [bacterium]
MVWSWLRRSTLLLLWSAIVLCGGVLDTLANGLSIAPIRLVFDGRSRVATVYLTNKSDAEATYRILVRDKRMLETGQIVDAAEALPGERFASDLLRFSPRRVVLGPGASQTVRVMLRNPSEGRLEHGEYRTHLVFQSVPNAPTPEELAQQDGHTVAQAIIETSIPVIIRRDNPDAAISFTSAALDTALTKDGRPQLELVLAREGERSVYGDITVDWIDGRGRAKTIARAVGIAVYHPTPRRHIRLPLNVPGLEALSDGRLYVRFEESALGRGDLWSDTTVDLVAERIFR